MNIPKNSKFYYNIKNDEHSNKQNKKPYNSFKNKKQTTKATSFSKNKDYQKKDTKNNPRSNQHTFGNYIPFKNGFGLPKKQNFRKNKFHKKQNYQNFRKNLPYKKYYRETGERYNRKDTRFIRHTSLLYNKNTKFYLSSKKLLYKKTKSVRRCKIVYKKKNPFIFYRNKRYNNARKNLRFEYYKKVGATNRVKYLFRKKLKVQKRKKNVFFKICKFPDKRLLPKTPFNKKKYPSFNFHRNNSRYNNKKQAHKKNSFNKFKKRKFFNKNKRPITKNKYLLFNHKIRKGVFLKQPLLKDIRYPFILNLKLVSEYFAKN